MRYEAEIVDIKVKNSIFQTIKMTNSQIGARYTKEGHCSQVKTPHCKLCISSYLECATFITNTNPVSLSFLSLTFSFNEPVLKFPLPFIIVNPARL